MSKLTQEKIEVLDKLYNIKGDDSVVTTAIKAKIDKKEADIETTTTEKNHVIEQQTELEKELQLFIEQTDKFLATFSLYDNTSFSSFQSIGIDLAIGDALATLRQKAPGHEDNLEDRIKGLKDQVEELEEKIASIEEKKEEFIKTLNAAEEAKEKINDLIDDIIRNNNDAYPRKYVKEVLENLCFFSPEEISMLEFLILFKEEGLMEYDETYETRGNKFEAGLNPQEEVMLTGEIFANDAKEEEAKEEEKEEEPAPTPTINLAPSSGILTPVAKVEEPSSAVSAFKEKKEPVIEVEETTGGIFAPETPVEMPTEEDEEVDKVPVHDIPDVDAVVEAPSVDDVPPVFEPIVDETPGDTNVIDATDEVSPRQPLVEEKNESEDVKPEVMAKITTAGLDLTKVQENDKYKAVQLFTNVDDNTLNTNHELLRSINVSEETLYRVYNVESEAV